MELVDYFAKNTIIDLETLDNNIKYYSRYLLVGGGIGSFIFFHNLRNRGVSHHQILTVGPNLRAYAKFKVFCNNSQIDDNTRLRSDSSATPDNLWGIPGFAVREIINSIADNRFKNALKITWQIFSETLFSEPYTPKAGDVFKYIDSEAVRINWAESFKKGFVLSIRKTTDLRYVVLVRFLSNDNVYEDGLVVTNFVHLSTGNWNAKYLPEVERYRQDYSKNIMNIVNAYENHDHIYKYIKNNPATIVVRGRGITASRIIEKIIEIKKEYKQKIRIINILRGPKKYKEKFSFAYRKLIDDWEYQHFNFPKSCFGGNLKTMIHNLPEEKRAKVIRRFGAVTAAPRRKFMNDIYVAKKEGWFHTYFGEVNKFEFDGNQVLLYLYNSINDYNLNFRADFVVDSVGLESDLRKNRLYLDMINTYNLKLNEFQKLKVENNYAVEGMENGFSRVFASGIITTGNKFAPVDSFAGHQYVVNQILEYIENLKVLGVHRLSPVYSFGQWFRWVLNIKPLAS
jgi:hypothetical protein